MDWKKFKTGLKKLLNSGWKFLFDDFKTELLYAAFVFVVVYFVLGMYNRYYRMAIWAAVAGLAFFGLKKIGRALRG